MLSPEDVANLYGVSVSTVKRHCDKGLLKATRLKSGHRIIEESAVIAHAARYGWTLVK
jgi:predicted site-specific integrase-resolvase